MYVFKDANNNIFAISDTLDYQENGNPLINNGKLAIAAILVADMEETDILPSGWQQTVDEEGDIYYTPIVTETEEDDTVSLKELIVAYQEGVNTVE